MSYDSPVGNCTSNNKSRSAQSNALSHCTPYFRSLVRPIATLNYVINCVSRVSRVHFNASTDDFSTAPVWACVSACFVRHSYFVPENREQHSSPLRLWDCNWDWCNSSMCVTICACILNTKLSTSIRTRYGALLIKRWRESVWLDNYWIWIQIAATELCAHGKEI